MINHFMEPVLGLVGVRRNAARHQRRLFELASVSKVSCGMGGTPVRQSGLRL